MIIYLLDYLIFVLFYVDVISPFGRRLRESRAKLLVYIWCVEMMIIIITLVSLIMFIGVEFSSDDRCIEIPLLFKL